MSLPAFVSSVSSVETCSSSSTILAFTLDVSSACFLSWSIIMKTKYICCVSLCVSSYCRWCLFSALQHSCLFDISNNCAVTNHHHHNHHHNHHHHHHHISVLIIMMYFSFYILNATRIWSYSNVNLLVISVNIIIIIIIIIIIMKVKGLTQIRPLSCGFDSSAGRALHQHRRGHLFESCSEPEIFFRSLFK